MLKSIASVLLTCLLTGGFLFAQSRDEKEVAAKVESFRKAMVSADRSTLEELTAPELSYGHSSGVVENKTAFVDEFVTGQAVFTSIALSDQSINISGDIAIVRHHFIGELNKSVPVKLDVLILMIWRKQGGEWKLLARQGARVPVQLK